MNKKGFTPVFDQCGNEIRTRETHPELFVYEHRIVGFYGEGLIVNHSEEFAERCTHCLAAMKRAVES